MAMLLTGHLICSPCPVNVGSLLLSDSFLDLGSKMLLILSSWDDPISSFFILSSHVSDLSVK